MNERRELEQIFLVELGLKIDHIEKNKNSLIFSLHCKVKTNANRNEIKITDLGEVLLAINEAPVDGNANKAILKLLSKKFGIPKKNIILLKGQKSKKKVFRMIYSFDDFKSEMFYINKIKNNFNRED